MEILLFPFSTAPTKPRFHRLPYNSDEFRIRVTSRLTVYLWWVHLGAKPLETNDQNFSLQLNTCGYSPLSREDGSLVYNCCWSSPAQSFSSPNLAWLITTYHCLRFDTPPTWRVRSPYLYLTGAWWSSYTSGHWVLFPSPRTAHGATLELFDPPPYEIDTNFQTPLGCNTSSWIWYKTQLIVVLQLFPWERACLWRRYLATAAYTY
jgi:hypothetical protein